MAENAFSPTLPSEDESHAREEAGSDSRVGALIADRYRIVRLLSAGGMGEVYRGEHLLLGHAVAIKYMRPHVAANPQQVGRFRREAHAMSLLKHPHIVAVLDFGSSHQDLYLVMEFLEGEPLSAWITRQPVLPPLGAVLDILDQALDALDASHLAGIAHRDIKPDNLFLTYPTGRDTPFVKLVDFGLAHIDEDLVQTGNLTTTGMIAGTPSYMSPEQCRSLAVGPSTDLYAMGCVLTEMLQGKPPFDASSPAEVMAHHMFMQPPPLARPPGSEPIPQALEKLRLDLLAKQPARRPANAGEARQRLRALRETADPLSVARAANEPLGDRQARIPQWDAPASAAVVSSRGPTTSRVPFLRFAQGKVNDLDACILALASQGVDLLPARALTDATKAAPDAVIFDIGPDIQTGIQQLSQLADRPFGHRVLVLAEGLDTAKINALVAAGAAEVLPYPITPEALLRRIQRVLRRRPPR